MPYFYGLFHEFLLSEHFVSFFLEQRSQNVSCSTGVSVPAALGLHHQDQVWEQHNHTEVGHTILHNQKYLEFMPIAHALRIHSLNTKARHKHTIVWEDINKYTQTVCLVDNSYLYV